MSGSLHQLDSNQARPRRRITRYKADSEMTFSNRKFKHIGLILLAFLGLGFVARPGYQQLKEWRAVRLVRQANVLLLAGELSEAIKTIRIALKLAPQQPEVLRCLAQVGSAAKVPQAVSYWKMLAQASSLTLEDHHQFVNAALESGQFQIAEEQLLALKKLDPGNRETRVQTRRSLELQNRFDEAILLARESLALAPAEPGSHFSLATLLSRSVEPTNQAAGRAILWQFSTSTNAYQMAAIDFLMDRGGLTLSECATLAEALGKRTQASAADGLRLAELHLQLAPTNLLRIAEILTEPVRQQSSLFDTLLVADWLQSKGLPSNVLAFCEESVIRTNLNLLRPRIEALASLHRYAEIESILDTRERDLGPVVYGAYWALLNATKGNSTAAEAALRQALKASADNTVALRVISRAAENARRPAIAMASELQLLRHPGGALSSARNLIRLLGPTPGTLQASEVMEKIVEALPYETAYALELCYLRSLLGDDLPRVQKSLDESEARLGPLPEIQIVKALVLARTEQASTALGLLESGGIDWDAAPARWRAVYTFVLGKSRQSEAARRWAAKIAPTELRDLELGLISPWR